MCAVSMVGDHYTNLFRKQWPEVATYPGPGPYVFTETSVVPTPVITRKEFDALKQEVENMKLLLQRAKLYDQENNEPDCEMEDKVALLKKIAEMVGVDLSEVFK